VRRSRSRRPLFLLAALGAWLLPVAAAQEPTAPFPRRGAYAGVEACVQCHDRQHRLLSRGAHGVVLNAAALPGCETCHGPGKDHAADEGEDLQRITMPARLADEVQVAFCGRCHGDQIARHGGDLPGLRAAGKVCTDCHAVHERPRPAVLPGARFGARTDAVAAAEPTGSAACVACHPRRNELLAASAHASLASPAHDGGCETCHGHGSLHERTSGQRRLITRPDRAQDGIATCRGCHAGVDAVDFHWRGRRKPYLGADVTCTTCHVIHAARAETKEQEARDDPAQARPQGHAAAAPADAAAGAAPRAAAAPAGDGRATNRVCATCHVPALCTMPGAVHRSLGALDAPLQRGCGSCHEGGLAHARAAGRKDLVQPVRGASAADQARVCLQCHRDAGGLLHVRQGSHHRAGVGCVECHAPLHDVEPRHAAADAERSCGRCHGDVAAQFLQPNHHPVPEGRMRCTSCHDVHGSRPRLRDHDLSERRCVACHPRYRGPFVFPHQGSRRDGCMTCHVPHGSGNLRLLQTATTQQGCLQCHGDFPAFHDQTPGAVYTNCIACHTEVHGSNHSRFLFR
jgi:DmsE family decaheme c-type cytochrome